MKFTFESRAADSPFVESIWRTDSEAEDTFMSVAAIQWQMVICRQYGKSYFTVRGPETRAALAQTPGDAEFYGINFKVGTFMPKMPPCNMVNTGLDMPQALHNSFWFHGSTWEVPNFENADDFVARLLREKLLVRDPVVDATLEGHAQDISLRSVQRRFLRATGLTHGALCQIERATQAMNLLEQGVSILDVVDQAGYFDQPHLTRSLKRFVGRTPAEILSSYRKPDGDIPRLE
jgi:AraC-like DNA-binding protein